MGPAELEPERRHEIEGVIALLSFFLKISARDLEANPNALITPIFSEIKCLLHRPIQSRVFLRKDGTVMGRKLRPVILVGDVR
jgi:hypothetical protein